MHNFSIHSQVTVWIDRVVVAGNTFQYGANGPERLVPKATKEFIAPSRCSVYTRESPVASLKHRETSVKGELSLIGLKDITVIRGEGLSLGQDAKVASVPLAAVVGPTAPLVTHLKHLEVLCNR
jgi:FMN-dependent NADH-azoreductase